MKILAKTLHGSRLYKLDNEKSDWDYKAIHLPTMEDCLLLRAARNIHDKKETESTKMEYESFALQEFLALAARGEDVTITMLHVGDGDILEDSAVFNRLRANREMFYTKSMVGMVGFTKSMAAKYALRADRMETVEEVIMVLEAMHESGVGRLGQAWELLPNLPHTRKFENVLDRGADKRAYECVGKTLPATITTAYALDILTKVRDNYGERVIAARNMDGYDLKALSHSFRVGYQLKHLYTEGTFSFPLPETPFIRAVKEGTLNYVNDGLDARLNDLITEVEGLAAKSTFPDKVDQTLLDDLVLETYSNEYNLNDLL